MKMFGILAASLIFGFILGGIFIDMRREKFRTYMNECEKHYPIDYCMKEWELE